MKKIFSPILLLLATASIGQVDIQATLRKAVIQTPGSSDVVEVYLKPTAALNTGISDFVFTIQVPAGVDPKPVITDLTTGSAFATAFAAGWQPVLEATANGFHHYRIAASTPNSAAAISWAGSSDEKLVVSFKLNTSANVTESVRLSHLANGGGEGAPFNQQYQYTIYTTQAGDNSDATPYAKMFYGPTSFPDAPVPGDEFAGYGTYQYSNANSVLLPVNFKSFYAIKSGDDAKLTWDVSSDEKNNYFEVMRSSDGRNFKTIQKINALGNGLSDNSYQSTDINLSTLGSREIYYQIQQFDKDGQSTKSPVRMLSVDGLGKSVTAFPNPAKTTTKVVVDAPEAGKGTLIMRDAAGRQVRVMNAQFFKGINQIDMNVMNLASGDYNIQVSGGGVNETIKITKIN
jgi:hypothetical protein